MKKLAFVLVVLFAINTQAQQRMDRQQRVKDLTPEQFATLQTKKMTLDLDLSEDQQKKVQKLNQEIAENLKKARENRDEDLTQDERFEIKNKMLDKQIAHQKEMKKILNEEQFEKWQKIRKHKKHAFKQKRKHKRGDRDNRFEARD
ncbi:hypothetical protein [Urechidicola croceus]|uniref:DUF4890 domain-containing protein n=1 Tax=Urechidicola croceus TaxID=1850246 RepID=A0A1D8PAU1_9FLAO|nr:hypothetical protein [Urechidicola croceus]AOW21687.1 hypothetical protein LPB138_13795 [Urechidicola croceus]